MEIQIGIEDEKQIKVGQLDRELRETLGTAYQGLSFSGYQHPLRLYFEEGTATAIFDQADAIVAAHVPEAEVPPPLTVEERLAAFEERLGKLEKKQ